jgi:hypothetical protein
MATPLVSRAAGCARVEPLSSRSRKPHQDPVYLGRSRRLGKGLRGIRGERLKKVADETPPSLRGSVPGGGHHAGVGHQDQRHVLVSEILPQPAGGLGPACIRQTRSMNPQKPCHGSESANASSMAAA